MTGILITKENMDKGTADTLGEHRVMNKVSTSQEMTEMPVEKKQTNRS